MSNDKVPRRGGGLVLGFQFERIESPGQAGPFGWPQAREVLPSSSVLFRRHHTPHLTLPLQRDKREGQGVSGPRDRKRQQGAHGTARHSSARPGSHSPLLRPSTSTGARVKERGVGFSQIADGSCEGAHNARLTQSTATEDAADAFGDAPCDTRLKADSPDKTKEADSATVYCTSE